MGTTGYLPWGLVLLFVGVITLALIALLYGLAFVIDTTVRKWVKSDYTSEYSPFLSVIEAIPYAIVFFSLGMVLFGGDLTAKLAYKAYLYIADILDSQWSLIIWIIFALFLFLLRQRSSFKYGLVEIYVGISSILGAMDISASQVGAKTLAFAGGLYIIIRGMDNLDKGMPSKSPSGIICCSDKAF